MFGIDLARERDPRSGAAVQRARESAQSSVRLRESPNNREHASLCLPLFLSLSLSLSVARAAALPSQEVVGCGRVALMEIVNIN